MTEEEYNKIQVFVIEWDEAHQKLADSIIEQAHLLGWKADKKMKVKKSEYGTFCLVFNVNHKASDLVKKHYWYCDCYSSHDYLKIATLPQEDDIAMQLLHKISDEPSFELKRIKQKI